MWTGDLKKFVIAMIPKAFTPPTFATPPDINNSNIRHQSSSTHCEITFSCKAHAEHFISYVQRYPDALDIHDNNIKLRAKFAASPKERAMGRILTSAYDHIQSSGGFDRAVMELQTNRAMGTLSIRYRGLAYVVLQIWIPRNNAGTPHARRGTMRGDVVPGITDAILLRAVELANAAIVEFDFTG